MVFHDIWFDNFRLVTQLTFVSNKAHLFKLNVILKSDKIMRPESIISVYLDRMVNFIVDKNIAYLDYFCIISLCVV